MLAAVSAAALFGALGSAQAAVAAPYVAYAHFTRTTGNFYSAFGDMIDVSVGNSPTGTAVCVSHSCRSFTGGEVHIAGTAFGQYWAHGQSRLVEVFACNATCMPSVWTNQLAVP
jgi:hypothetical protein